MRPRSSPLVATLALVAGTAGAGDDAYPRLAGLERGRTVWLGTCQACHGEGFADAPAVADRSAWAPRVAQGRALLYRHALQGHFGANGAMMPPRGGNAELSDDDVRQAVDYMLGLVAR